ncbi:MAG TPA: [FeFe] hydrogenase H-cluster maturation GTPase HydF [Polyangia bacterium]|jgi:[FeFe] hydrogenase H-cluster maturation GTPase HydF
MAGDTARGLRLHLGLFGRRNAGKSSLLNALARQEISLVSDVPGTTTDPVEKPFELPPLGPVVFIDTAGLDDEGPVGALRVARTRRVLDGVDLALLVTDGGRVGPLEEELCAELRAREVPVVLVWNKADAQPPDVAGRAALARLGAPVVATAATSGDGVPELLATLARLAPQGRLEAPLLADLVGPGDLALLVVPLDPEAPKGRLILPQVQTIRDALDADACTLVVKERELRHALGYLGRPPALIVTDSQALLKVAADAPPGVPLTTFSILFARHRGDLTAFVRGCGAVERLRPGDRVLVAEACSHHPSGEDIGRVKIPRWLTQYVGFPLEFTTVSGRDFPADLARYQLVVHCGGCMLSRREVLARVRQCGAAGVPITNFGMMIAYSLGVFERALGPFPGALEVYRAMRAGYAGVG